jgi:hypothetical protein
VISFCVEKEGKFDGQGGTILTNPIESGLLHVADSPGVVVLDNVGNGVFSHSTWRLYASEKRGP